jgi:NADH:ubiquinone oxidoreductase subunit 2 (subunit N)
MEKFYEKYIISIIEKQNLNFKTELLLKKANKTLNLIQKDSNLLFYERYDETPSSLILSLFFPDILLFIGLIAVILVLGLNFNKVHLFSLFSKINKVCLWFLGSTLVISVVQWTLMFFKIKFIVPIFSFRLTYFNKIDWYEGVSILNNSFQSNIYTQSIKIIILLIVLSLFIYINSFLSIKNNININEVSILIYISIFLSFIIVSSTHFILLLLSLESFSLILYIMTTLDRTQGGVTSAVKYFTFGTLGSIFLF